MLGLVNLKCVISLLKFPRVEPLLGTASKEIHLPLELLAYGNLFPKISSINGISKPKPRMNITLKKIRISNR